MPKARQAFRLVVNSVTAVVVAIAIFAALVNAGVISRTASENVAFGG